MGLSAPKHVVRNDIEGLRAVAVLAVLFSHVMPSALQGGFTGVDVFFVISGYLIGKHLLEDIQAGRFSFLRFYGRRARRLLPALCVVLVAVWGMGWLILSGPEMAALGKHIAAATIFANNILLWSESGYFDAPSITKPLLHLWSLGVEEQFYLLVPFLLWLGASGRHASIRWVVRLSVVSLLLTILRGVPSFYLLDTRFWELGAGVMIGYLALHDTALSEGTHPVGKKAHREILAYAFIALFAAVLLYGSKQVRWSEDAVVASSGLITLFVLAIIAIQFVRAYQRPGAWHRLMAACGRHRHGLLNAIALLGIALIAISFFAMGSTDWPGPQTLLPVLGTVLVIAAGPATRVNKSLGYRPLVFVGGISYPLYLWHWPAIVFWRMLSPDAGAAWGLVPACAAVLLAWATKELVENPARFGRLWTMTVSPPPIGALSLGLLTTGLLGLSALALGGYPSRFSPTLRAIANLSLQHPETDWRVHRCYFIPGETDTFAEECTPDKRPGIPRVLLWGDSHAAHLYPGLVNLQKQHEFDLIQWTAAGCPPTRTPLATDEKNCPRLRATALRELPLVAPNTVLLAGAWELYLQRGVRAETMIAAVMDDIRWLQQSGIRRIVVFGPGPTWNPSLPTELVRYMGLRRTEEIPVRLGTVSDAVWHLDVAMFARVAAAEARYVSVLNLFCDRSGCRTSGDGEPRPDLLFGDRDHLTVRGSRLLTDAVARQMFMVPPDTQ